MSEYELIKKIAELELRIEKLENDTKNSTQYGSMSKGFVGNIQNYTGACPICNTSHQGTYCPQVIYTS